MVLLLLGLLLISSLGQLLDHDEDQLYWTQSSQDQLPSHTEEYPITPTEVPSILVEKASQSTEQEEPARVLDPDLIDPGRGEGLAEWAFYVYMAADNSLSDEADDDLREMQLVGSRSGLLEIVTLTDFKLVSDKSDSHTYKNGTTRLYHVERGSLKSRPLSLLDPNWTYELDMGKGETLTKFLQWAVNEYPARNRALVIWDHGSGWKKVAEDQDGSFLSMPEIGAALEQVNVSFEIIGFDACLMAMTEIAHTLNPHTRYVLGSQAYEPSDGWTYDTMLGQFLQGIGSLDNAELAAGLVDDYIQSYRNGSVTTSFSVTYSALDTMTLATMERALANFTHWLVNLSHYYHLRIDEARKATQTYKDGDYRDLYDLSLELEDRLKIPQFQAAARELREAMEEVIFAEDHWKAPSKREVKDSHGLSIYFPASRIRSGYSDLAFTEQTPWMDFLSTFHLPRTPQARFNHTLLEPLDSDRDGYNESVNWTVGFKEAQAGGWLQVQLLDPHFRVVESHNYTLGTTEGNIQGGPIRPTASNSYRLQFLLFDRDGSLERMEISDAHYLDLRLPDLAIDEMELGYNGLELEGLVIGDEMNILVTLENRGTTPSSPGQLHLSYPTDQKQSLNYSALDPGEQTTLSFVWSPTGTGEVLLGLQATSDLGQQEATLVNNRLERKVMVHELTPSPFQLKLDVEHLDYPHLDLENETFLPGRLNATISNLAPGLYDLAQLASQAPPGWELGLSNQTYSLGMEDTHTLGLEYFPPWRTPAGKYEILIWPVSRDGIPGETRSLSVEVPSYSGVALTATLDRQSVKPGKTAKVLLTVSNQGNAMLRLTLVDEGVGVLDPQLENGYFELPAFSVVNTTASLQVAEEMREGTYPVKFHVKNASGGQVLLTVTLMVPVKESQSAGHGLWVLGAGSVLVLTALLMAVRHQRT